MSPGCWSALDSSGTCAWEEARHERRGQRSGRTLELVLGSLCVAARGVEVVPDTTGGTEAEGERDSRLGHVVVVVGGEEDGCSIDWCVGEELEMGECEGGTTVGGAEEWYLNSS